MSDQILQEYGEFHSTHREQGPEQALALARALASALASAPALEPGMVLGMALDMALDMVLDNRQEAGNGKIRCVKGKKILPLHDDV
ncbi:unnamed protein product [Haemonchus placei]|uniref:Transcriptional regulator n=1 Tax=Haemonchus placei TaxID=6290 RepID=A0A0N4VW33_HAEPC|nr:unnamed protein product [Haemonchus placei]